MPIVYRFSNGLLPAAAEEVVRVSHSPMVITSMWFANADTSKREVTVYHVPADQDVGDDHLLLHSLDVRIDSTVINDTPIYLEQGDSVWAFADVADKVAASFYAIPFHSWERSR